MEHPDALGLTTNSLISAIIVNTLAQLSIFTTERKMSNLWQLLGQCPDNKQTQTVESRIADSIPALHAISKRLFRLANRFDL